MDYIILVATFLAGAFIGCCCSTVEHMNDYKKGYNKGRRDKERESAYLYTDWD